VFKHLETEFQQLLNAFALDPSMENRKKIVDFVATVEQFGWNDGYDTGVLVCGDDYTVFS
jgi:hypothetical protein